MMTNPCCRECQKIEIRQAVECREREKDAWAAAAEYQCTCPLIECEHADLPNGNGTEET